MQEGEIAAETLLGLLSAGRGTKSPKTRESRKFEIIERETTSVGTPSKHLANKAMLFIRQNFKSGIGTEDVMSSVRGRRDLQLVRPIPTPDGTASKVTFRIFQMRNVLV